MPFSQDSIAAGPTLSVVGLDLRVDWSSTAPEGTAFQVYVGRRLAWSGTSRSALLPLPTVKLDVQVGAVGPGESATDFSDSLPPAAGTPRRPSLSWRGGRYLGDSLDHFAVYRSAVAGGPVDMSRPAGIVPAAEQGLWHDGYGDGGYGDGGYGAADQPYRWEGAVPLGPGTWSFAVVPVDAAGNPGAAVAAELTVAAPPEPPAARPDGRRLAATYDPSTRVATLSWLSAPI